MTTTEDRLRRALAARAQLVTDQGLTPVPAGPGRKRTGRWTALAVGGVAAAVAVTTATLVAFGGGDGSPEPAPPAPSTPGTESPTEARGDVDGDGVEDVVRLDRGALVVELSVSGETATRKVARGGTLAGLADVGSDRALVVAGGQAYRVTDGGRIAPVVGGWTPEQEMWVGEGRLLTGTPYEHDGRTYLATYAWAHAGDGLRATALPMHCWAGDGAPQACGEGSFVGDDSGLPPMSPVLDAPTVRPGDGAVEVTMPDGSRVSASLEGSQEGEIRAGDVELVVGGLRAPVPEGGAPYLFSTALEHQADLLLVVGQYLGDSTATTVFRYDGDALAPVPVEAHGGLALRGGGPALGGPQVITWATTAGRFFTARSEAGQDFYEETVEWVWDGDRLVANPLGLVCIDSAGDLDSYGACDLP